LESFLDHKLEEGSSGSELGGMAEKADSILEHHIVRQMEMDSLSLVYLCRLCSKPCKSRDECANHIEVWLLIDSNDPLQNFSTFQNFSLPTLLECLV
jgi:hypothetical protein